MADRSGPTCFTVLTSLRSPLAVISTRHSWLSYPRALRSSASSTWSSAAVCRASNAWATAGYLRRHRFSVPGPTPIRRAISGSDRPDRAQFRSRVSPSSSSHFPIFNLSPPRRLSLPVILRQTPRSHNAVYGTFPVYLPPFAAGFPHCGVKIHTARRRCVQKKPRLLAWPFRMSLDCQEASAELVPLASSLPAALSGLAAVTVPFLCLTKSPLSKSCFS